MPNLHSIECANVPAATLAALAPRIRHLGLSAATPAFAPFTALTSLHSLSHLHPHDLVAANAATLASLVCCVSPDDYSPASGMTLPLLPALRSLELQGRVDRCYFGEVVPWFKSLTSLAIFHPVPPATLRTAEAPHLRYLKLTLDAEALPALVSWVLALPSLAAFSLRLQGVAAFPDEHWRLLSHTATRLTSLAIYLFPSDMPRLLAQLDACTKLRKLACGRDADAALQVMARVGTRLTGIGSTLHFTIDRTPRVAALCTSLTKLSVQPVYAAETLLGPHAHFPPAHASDTRQRNRR